MTGPGSAPPDQTAMQSAPSLGLSARSLAPDLARGLMLLFIAVANGPSYLWGGERGLIGAHPAGGSAADLVAQTVAIIAIDGRSYPMFAFLFGYGIVQLYRRQQDAGISHPDARRLLRRRHLWMLAFGFVHAALLWYGDILGAYGLAGLLLCWLFLDRRDATLRVWATVLTALLVVVALLVAAAGVVVALSVPSDTLFGADAIARPEPNAEPNYLISIAARIEVWAALTPATVVIGLVVPIAILVAFVAARHRVLEAPGAHPRLLIVTAVVGLIVGVGTGVVLALQNLGVWGVDRNLDWAFLAGHVAGGLFGGLGYVALFALVAERIQRRPTGPGWFARAMRAVGQRALTCYLAQSVMFAPLLCAWGLGLGDRFSSWTVAVLAVGVWLVTVVLAVSLQAASRRGPAEWLLRRLVASCRARAASTA